MNRDNVSLRALVDKWLAPTQSVPARITQVGRLGCTGARYVRLEGQVSKRPLSIVFFRHSVGAWDVFPPAPAAAAMGARLFAS
ncbi:hypothetical protein CUJ91_32065 (plasmid) [Paraburkholderia graminis]|uniref:hypothetical protein n=1 Tax=Paraburkholderia graminis TaxID=60548 RepID=UPI000DEFEAA3|nr:hypothetical protein [Paraburkholderia graminis]AXF12639.1 hypothetical protein CUJ91_32065 [Paraburkholderia graminis]